MSTVLLLTHKRRGAVVVFPAGTESYGEALAHVLCEPEPRIESDAHGTYWLGAAEGPIAGLGTFDTAEVLTFLYRSVLARAGLTDASVATIAVGVGPGSFTGLRLGCAFANGLLLGRARGALAVPVPSNEEARAILDALVDSQGLGEERRRELLGEPPREGEDDPFSAPVSLADVLALARAIDAGVAQGVGEFVPAYGREPGPVLKLRSEGGRV